MTRDWLKSENFEGTRHTVCQDCSSLPARKPARGQQARRRRQRSSSVWWASSSGRSLLDLLCNDESALARWLCWCEELSKLAVTDTGAGKTPLDIMAHVSDIKKARQRCAQCPQACAWFWESKQKRRPPCQHCLGAKVNVLAGHCPQRRKHHRDEPTGLPLQGHALGRSHSAGWNSASERRHQSLLGAKNLSCNGDETKSVHARTF